MAEIRRGKLKGQEVRVIQWCNDWFSVDPGGIVSPTNIKLTDEEAKNVLTHHNNGSLLKEYILCEDGTFKRRRINA